LHILLLDEKLSGSANKKSTCIKQDRRYLLIKCTTLPGSADICFVTETSMQQVIEHLNFQKITILAGPAERDGATGPLQSIYIKDPDGNLIEISNQIDK